MPARARRQKRNVQLARFGAYYLKRERNKEGTCGLYKYDNGQSNHVYSTGTANVEEACRLSEEWLIEHREIKLRKDMLVLEAIKLYYTDVARKQRSEDVVRAAMADIIKVFGHENGEPEDAPCVTLMVSQFVPSNQSRFISELRKQMRPQYPSRPDSPMVRRVKDSTIKRRLTAIFAAFKYCVVNGELASFPPRLPAKRWPDAKCKIERTKGQMTEERAIALFNHCADNEAAWRACYIHFGTYCRNEAAKDATIDQLDSEYDVYHLNPEGREQTDKYRASVPLPWMLAEWMRRWVAADQAADPNWEANSKRHLILLTKGRKKNRGKPVSKKSGTFFRKTVKKVDPSLKPRDIRRFGSTLLVQDPEMTEWEKDMVMGHNRPAQKDDDSEASATGRTYNDYDPRTMRRAAIVMARWFERIAPFVKRPLIPPMTAEMKMSAEAKEWWARQGSNLRPSPCEGDVLPLNYAPNWTPTLPPNVTIGGPAWQPRVNVSFDLLVNHQLNSHGPRRVKAVMPQENQALALNYRITLGTEDQ